MGLNKLDIKTIRNCSIINIEKIEQEIKDHQFEIDRLRGEMQMIRLMNKKINILGKEGGQNV